MIPKIVIVIKDGLVSKVATTMPECNFVVVDFDSLRDVYAAWVHPPEVQDEQFTDGEAYLLFDVAKAHENEAADELKHFKF